MKILITGASGFIGRHLVNKLSERQNAVIYALNRSPMDEGKKNFIPIQADLSANEWTKALPHHVDIVLHLAQSRRHRDFPDGAEDMVRVNVLSTLQLLEWSRINKVKRFLFSSTGNVYKSEDKMLAEGDVCEPISMYAATKLSAEHLIRQYSIYYQTVVLRIFGVYGPGQVKMVIPDIIYRIKMGKKISLAEGIGFYLTPLYVSDCITMIEEISFLANPFNFEIFNISGSETAHLGDVVSAIERILERKANIDITDAKPKYLRGDNRKICQLLNRHPIIKLNEGLKNTILNDSRVDP